MTVSPKLTPEQLTRLKDSLPTLPDKQKRRVLELLKTYDAQMTQNLGKDSFLDFVKHVYPGYK